MLNYIVRQMLKQRYSLIASHISVGPEWQEFSCEKPLKPRGFIQHIALKIAGYECFDPKHDVEIKLKDGRILQPIIEVVDANGITYSATDGQRVGSQIGFLIRPNEDTSLSISSERQYLTVRIRSEEPFECECIEWKTKRMK